MITGQQSICYLLLLLCAILLIVESLRSKRPLVLIGILAASAVVGVFTIHLVNDQKSLERATRAAIVDRYDVNLPDSSGDWDEPFPASIDEEDASCTLEGEGPSARLRCEPGS